MQNKIKTSFHYITPHTRNAVHQHTAWNWKTPLTVGDEIYVWMPAFGGYSKKTVTEFVRAADWDSSPAGLYFISDDGIAYEANGHKDSIIRKPDGSWIHANGKDGTDYANRYEPHNTPTR
jgi:hypothetical protein